MRKHTIIIAEAGVNHNGSLATAKKLIEAAARAQADYIKFQTFKTKKLVSKTAQKASYQQENLKDADNSQFKMLEKLELSEDMHHEIAMHCSKNNIGFLSTPFDEESADFLHELGMTIFKIPSGDITNKPLLQHIAAFGKPMIMSTGMSNIKEIKEAVDVICGTGLSPELITLLHCNSQYPTPMEDVNLKAMKSIAEELNTAVGYSDHTLGIEIPIAATALGACVIEKHITLDRNMEGPDHLASIEPQMLQEMVKAIRNTELAISKNGEKTPSPSEISNRELVRKSIHAARPIAKGHSINKSDLIMLRPGDGISPMEIDAVIGKVALQDFPEGAIIQFKGLEK